MGAIREVREETGVSDECVKLYVVLTYNLRVLMLFCDPLFLSFPG